MPPQGEVLSPSMWKAWCFAFEREQQLTGWHWCERLSQSPTRPHQAVADSVASLKLTPTSPETTVTRSTRLAAAALAASAALLLSACGGSDDKGNDEIAGADSDTEKSASSSPSASADGIDRPEIKLPKDDKLLFEEPDDAKEASVLNDNREFIRATDDAIVRGNSKSSALRFYAKGDALKVSVDWVQQFVDAGQSVSGTVRYYNRKVTFLKDGSAGLTYCGDETKAYNEDTLNAPQDSHGTRRDCAETHRCNSARSGRGCVAGRVDGECSAPARI